MIDFDKDSVCILIPTLNEEATIQQLIRDFHEEGFHNIFVIDGNSSDKTRELAEAEGARVEVQHAKGKGQAVQQAFEMIDSPYVVMTDGDRTYLASDIYTMIEPLVEGKADQVIGNRFANYEKGAFTKLNLLGNQMLNKLFGLAYGIWLEDILSGYRGFTKRAIKDFHLNETGFEIETEIAVDSVRKEHRIEVVPITYITRHSSGATKLNPLTDGFKIGTTIYKLAKLHNPMFYFGAIGGGFVVAGTITGIFVISEWLQGVTRIPMTILTALLIISGIQMLIFGMLSDLVVSLHRETMRMMRKNQK
ncbi:dolichol-phosphate mannosyltransferase [Methanohalophilus levihalophilus]|uniref:S-layer glycoprotein N-glycosyltransferase AglJ n=1 Tax=Methanohalophilus levihalophilus TaxID=1431282 RepID=UPI001AEB59F5|nr:S-layer glycoprotein N-glycosyltransferase AglJ [Methanohalophilus levihalophilus]MBP2030714.1 dolichol-phosphate mannosyltransferase [Methanohalophilus levihalophilus]